MMRSVHFALCTLLCALCPVLLGGCRGVSPLGQRIPVGTGPIAIVVGEGADRQTDLFAFDAAGGEVVRLTFTRGREAALSLHPAGVVVAFLRRDAGVNDSGPAALVALNLINSSEREAPVPAEIGVARRVGLEPGRIAALRPGRLRNRDERGAAGADGLGAGGHPERGLARRGFGDRRSLRHSRLCATGDLRQGLHQLGGDALVRGYTGGPEDRAGPRGEPVPVGRRFARLCGIGEAGRTTARRRGVAGRDVDSRPTQPERDHWRRTGHPVRTAIISQAASIASCTFGCSAVHSPSATRSQTDQITALQSDDQSSAVPARTVPSCFPAATSWVRASRSRSRARRAGSSSAADSTGRSCSRTAEGLFAASAMNRRAVAREPGANRFSTGGG